MKRLDGWKEVTGKRTSARGNLQLGDKDKGLIDEIDYAGDEAAYQDDDKTFQSE